MKQTISIALVLAVLLCCGACAAAQPAPQETVTQHQDGSYLVSTVKADPAQPVPAEGLCCVRLATGEQTAVVLASPAAIVYPRQAPELTDEMLVSMNTLIGSASAQTYPTLEKQPDGSYSVVMMDACGNPVSTDGTDSRIRILMGNGWDPNVAAAVMEHYPAYPVLHKLPDGSYTVVMLNRDGKPIPRTKTATKISRFYSADGTLQWTMEVTATFTYDGYSSACTDVSGTVTIADTNSWYLIEQNTNRERAALGVTFGRVTLGVTTSTPEFILEISCDGAGNLS